MILPSQYANCPLDKDLLNAYNKHALSKLH